MSAIPTQEYTDIKIVECNRLHSEEAKGGNNENYSQWTNNLQDILYLEPQDQVSVYGAFISERGAGQSSTVEIKGVELGPQTTINYINLSKTLNFPDRLDFNLPSQCSSLIAEEVVETFPVRDDNLRFTINYYIPANAMNSLHLPRRWMYGKPGTARDNYIEVDNITIHGMSWTDYKTDHSGIGNFWFPDDFYYCLPNSDGDTLLKPVNDNSRYTIMVRDVTHFTEQGYYDDGESMPDVDLRDPENAVYRTYKEMKNIEIPAGFNSPEFISTEITRQLQSTVQDKTLVNRRDQNEVYPVAVSKLLESETYKAFTTGNVYDNSIGNFLDYFNLSAQGFTVSSLLYRPSWDNLSGFEWLRQYAFIGCKYPEIYEKGRLINTVDNASGNASYNGILGNQLYSDYTGGRAGLQLDLTYNKENCKLFKDFFDAQSLYPEIIDNLNDDRSGYIKTYGLNTLDNTRWCHINRETSTTMCLSNPIDLSKSQLGWGGYYIPRTKGPPLSNDPRTFQLRSIFLPLFYDSNQSETFYENPQTDDHNQYTYGALGKSTFNKILIYPTRHLNMGYFANPNFWDYILFKSLKVEEGRKIGFDLHFNADAMKYLLPLSGWTIRPDGTSSYAGQGGQFDVPNASGDNRNNALAVPTLNDMNQWKKLLYIGADSPQAVWDGTHFGFSGLHTSMNRSNDWRAGNPAFTTVDLTDDFTDTVYKIHPEELYQDYTPDRMPYVEPYNLSQRITNSGTAITVPRHNMNIERWKIYDMLSGIFIDTIGVPENIWNDTLWGLLGFTYAQFHSNTNNRLVRVGVGNVNDLSVITTNAEVLESETKIYSTNWAGTPMLNGMITTPTNIFWWDATYSNIVHQTQIYPSIVHKCGSMVILAQNLPTRMIRGYYTIRSNILEGTPFIGGKVNNTTLPIIGVVDKINGDGDFYFGQESSLSFTITKPIRIASVSISIHDPDGSYARTSEQSTILFKVTKPKQVVFNVLDQILQMNKSQQPPGVQRL